MATTKAIARNGITIHGGSTRPGIAAVFRHEAVLMFNLFRKTLKEASRIASVPAGQRFYVIGDIHGRLDLLNRLLDMIDVDAGRRGPADCQLVFLGDLIDRGPESAGVVERARQLAIAAPNTKFLMGNHEEVFLKALDGDVQAMRFFCRIGGRETILSYGISEPDYLRMDHEELVAALQQSVPESHRTFIGSFNDMLVVGDYAFVHAGIRPGAPLADQRPGDLRWIREAFIESTQVHECVVVHGHTISDEVEFRPNRIGIDTGAHLTGKLTCLALEGTDRWIIAT